MVVFGSFERAGELVVFGSSGREGMFDALECVGKGGSVLLEALAGGEGLVVSGLCKEGPFVPACVLFVSVLCGQFEATFVLKKSQPAMGWSVPFGGGWMRVFLVIHGAAESVHWSSFFY